MYTLAGWCRGGLTAARSSQAPAIPNQADRGICVSGSNALRDHREYQARRSAQPPEMPRECSLGAT